ncbi:MAG: hypothetical protein JWP12_2449 [Bacteroidetes bacterium]|nr:hypothetical protein [Bacteroidota bacterium]
MLSTFVDILYTVYRKFFQNQKTGSEHKKCQTQQGKAKKNKKSGAILIKSISLPSD